MSMTWAIEDVLVHKLVEEVAGYSTPDHFFANFEAQTSKVWLEETAGNGYDPIRNLVVLSYHTYVVRTPEFTVLIDGCIGNHKTIPMRPAWNNKQDSRWHGELRSVGLKPSDIDIVVCTHLHLDHVGWNTTWTHEGWKPTFPKARYLFVDEEHQFTEAWARTHRDDDPLGLAAVFETSYAESVAPIDRAGHMKLVPADHRVGRYLRFIPTSGHTPGHTAFGVGRDHDVAIFTGDLIHSPLQLRDPVLATRADEDVELALASRIRLLEKYTDSGVIAFTMHFPGSSAGYLTRTANGFSFDYLAPKEQRT